jgi:hypothetical protein
VTDNYIETSRNGIFCNFLLFHTHICETEIRHSRVGKGMAQHQHRFCSEETCEGGVQQTLMPTVPYRLGVVTGGEWENARKPRKIFVIGLLLGVAKEDEW